MEVRRYREGDRKALGHVLSLAFGSSDEEGERGLDPEKNRRLDPDQVHVVEEDGEARAMAVALPLEVFVDGEPAPMGGVAAVAAHPAYRRRGYAGALMRAVLRDLRARGVHLSMLDPFNHAFYRAHGYELAAEALRYTLKPGELPASPEQRHVRACREDDLPQMKALLEGAAARHPICVRRGEGRWRQFESDDGSEGRESVVYERDGEVEGHLIYRQKAGEGETPRTLAVAELVAETVRARAGLLSFAAAYDPEDWRVDYAVPRGEPLHPYLESSYVEARVRPGMMLRLVDVEGALGHLRRAPDEPLVLEVSDDGIPENAGEYTVGGGGVVRGAGSEDRVTLDVRQLSQLYAGYLPARQLARQGLLRGSPRALKKLEALFPAGDPWVFPLDHF